jgi:membrane protease YdiL (CAAX protease family)
MLEQMVTTQQTPAMILMIISAVIAAPIMEETLFRGLLHSSLFSIFKTQRWWLIFISSLIFSAIHFSAGAWQALPILFVLGMILAWLYERYRSLWPCIFVHAGFNAVNIVLAMIQMKSLASDTP